MITAPAEDLASKTSEVMAARKETASVNLTMDGMARQLAGKVLIVPIVSQAHRCDKTHVFFAERKKVNICVCKQGFKLSVC